MPYLVAGDAVFRDIACGAGASLPPSRLSPPAREADQLSLIEAAQAVADEIMQLE